MLSELALAKSKWTAGLFWKGLLARFTGLTIGNTLAYFVCVIPVVYGGKEPWPEEALWAYIIVGGQAVVVTVIQLGKRRFDARVRSAGETTKGQK